MELTPRKKRRETLLAAGVPAGFLDALQCLEQRDDNLQFKLRVEDDAYYYFGEAAGAGSLDWGDLNDVTVTPVYTGGNGDTFVLFCTDEHRKRFIYYGLEEQTLTDFGENFQLALANLVIEIYEFMDESPPEEIAAIAEEFGFVRPHKLIEALEKSSRPTFKADREWRERVLPALVAHDE